MVYTQGSPPTVVQRVEIDAITHPIPVPAAVLFVRVVDGVVVCDPLPADFDDDGEELHVPADWLQ